MAHCEVDSFLSKFKHLWHSGINATLTVKSTNGEATVVPTAASPRKGAFGENYKHVPPWNQRRQLVSIRTRLLQSGIGFSSITTFFLHTVLIKLNP